MTKVKQKLPRANDSKQIEISNLKKEISQLNKEKDNLSKELKNLKEISAYSDNSPKINRSTVRNIFVFSSLVLLIVSFIVLVFAQEGVKWQTLLVSIAITIIALLCGITSRYNYFSKWWSDWSHGLSTEMIGALITSIIFGSIILSAQNEYTQQLILRERKTVLMRLMASNNNNIALQAVEELWVLGGRTDGTLQDAWLPFANLKGASLFMTDLQRADLSYAILEEADLNQAILSGAKLTHANLANSKLTGTHLDNADLSYADLSGANLSGAQLENADFSNAAANQNTILPDGTHCEEAPACLIKFTNSLAESELIPTITQSSIAPTSTPQNTKPVTTVTHSPSRPTRLPPVSTDIINPLDTPVEAPTEIPYPLDTTILAPFVTPPRP